MKDISPSVLNTYRAFLSDSTAFALPLHFSNDSLTSLPSISYPKESQSGFQTALSQLDPVLSPRSARFLLVRRKEAIIAITFIPYLADQESRKLYLENRHDLVKGLGETSISASIICKEIGEITDIRSWNERDGQGSPWRAGDLLSDRSTETKQSEIEPNGFVQDSGYQKTKCRLCDRRMKNQIEEDAVTALKELTRGENCVQLSVDVSTETIVLNFHARNIAPDELSLKIPVSYPSFTFYRHPDSQRLYFIYSSPDSALVRERMTHTMAVPGLVNIIARECGVEVDQKVEIHEREDLVFEEGDERIGRFRSVYMLNKNVGTESVWEGMLVS